MGTYQEYLGGIEVFDEEAEQAPSQREVDVLKAFLAGDLPVEECAEQLVRRSLQADVHPITNKLRRSNLWSLFHELALRFIDTQPRLIELLQLFPTWHDDEDRSRPTGWSHRWADTMNICDNNYEDQEWDGATTWPNAVAFSARLVSTQNPSLAARVYLQQACRSIVRALDTDQPLRDPQRHRPDVLAAAHVFRLCPRALRELCAAGGGLQPYEPGDMPGTTILWSGGDIRIFSLERWEHWRERWRALAGDDALDDDIRKIAAGVADEML